jgi:hypothetical protein
MLAIVNRQHWCGAARALLVALVGCSGAHAQTQTSVGVPEKGHGAVSITVQHSVVNRVALPGAPGDGYLEIGEKTLRSTTLELDYGLTDRLAVTASIPFMSNRYVGSSPHDPRRLQDPHGEGFLDDGDFHSGWSDWGLGLRWLWRTDPVAITPFVAYHRPSHDYPIFTGTAFGTRQWRVDVGVNAGVRVPGPIRNLYLQGGYAYSYTEPTKPSGSTSTYRVNHSVLSLELGYLVTPRLSASLGWRYRKTHDALGLENFTPPFTDDLYYYHDRLFPLEQSVLSLSAGFQLNDRYSVAVGYGRTLRVEFGHDIKHALSVGVVRGF